MVQNFKVRFVEICFHFYNKKDFLQNSVPGRPDFVGHNWSVKAMKKGVIFKGVHSCPCILALSPILTIFMLFCHMGNFEADYFEADHFGATLWPLGEIYIHLQSAYISI